MELETRNELLKSEYLHLQSTVESFDSRVITIKAWSVTYSLASIGAAFATHAPQILVIAALSSLMFWLIEGFWKSFQQAHYPRIRHIEDYFSGQSSELPPMQIGKSWSSNYASERKKKNLLKILRWPHVALPHAFVFVLALSLYGLSCLDILSV